MKKSEYGSNLRLVVDNEARNATQPEVATKPRQMGIAYPDSFAIYLADVSGMSSVRFLEVMSYCIPACVIDLRSFPRFDRIARSRESAFKLLASAGASYIDLFGHLGRRSHQSKPEDKDAWVAALRDILKEKKDGGPYLLLFEDEELMNDAETVLPELFGPLVGEGAHFSVVREGEGGDASIDYPR